MLKTERTIAGLALAAVVAFMLDASVEAVDVKVEHDKMFDFRPVKTWTWNPQGAGDVKMARTQVDDPAAMKVRVDPVIRDAVAASMKERGLAEAADAPLTVTYYLLLTTNMSAQTFGQFLPGTVAWGLPPFAQATQSLEVMNQGSLVLDLSAGGKVVWRGVAQAKITPGESEKKREALLREGVRDLLRRYPPKS